MDFLKGELIEIIEWTDDSRDTLSFRFPDEDKEIKRGAQLIVRESQNVQFRAEAFNFPNHPNWGGANGGGVDSNPRSATFGKITNKGGERNIQLSLRYQF